MEVLPETQLGRKLSDEGNGSGDLDSITALLLSHKYKSNPIREPMQAVMNAGTCHLMLGDGIDPF